MCRSLIEIRYIDRDCNHGTYWELPSPDPACNGIRHFMVENQLKCKHCWVADGNKKKSWRQYGIRGTPGAGTRGAVRTRLRLNIDRIDYPIQAMSCKRQSDCPIWAPRYKWHTRDWAARALLLQRMDNIQEAPDLQ